MKIEEKQIYKYENKERNQVIVLYEIEKGLIINYPQGTIKLDGVKNLFNFLEEYSEKNNKKILLLIDNSNLKSIEIKARRYVIKFIKKKFIIEKAATFGNNFFMRNFMNLFSAIMSKMDVISYSFETKEEAIKWLKNNKKY